MKKPLGKSELFLIDNDKLLAPVIKRNGHITFSNKKIPPTLIPPKAAMAEFRFFKLTTYLFFSFLISPSHISLIVTP